LDAVDFRAIEVAVQPPMPPRVPRRLWNAATLCIAVASIVTASGVANAAIKFSIFYVVVQVEVSPHQETHRFNGARKIVINKNGDLQAGDKKRHLGVETSDIDKSNNETYYVAYKVDKDGILAIAQAPLLTV